MIQALIFDFDGLLVDTETPAFESWRVLYGEYGHDLSLDLWKGSLGTIHYFANGSKAFPKERLEVFAAGRVLQLDNFRKLAGFGWPGFAKMNLWRQDKGQAECAAAFVQAVRGGGASPIALPELLEVARVSIAIEEALR